MVGTLGIHHITLVCGDAGRTARFYTETLGLRLVKRTVNYDAPTTYHLYFGDDAATPGTLITFFEWPDAPPGQTGVGATHHVALAVPNEAVQLQWKRRLTDLGIAVDGPYDRTSFTSIYFRDPDGVIIELATQGPGFTLDEPAESLGSELRPPAPHLMIGQRDEAAIAATTWPEPVPEITPAMRLGRMHHITAMCRDIERTTAFWTEVLDLRLIKRTLNFDNPSAPHYYFGDRAGTPGTVITYFGYPQGMRPGRVGRGLTHHFALAVADDAAQLEWKERLERAGLPVSPVMDRQYFHSIYFRDPDGHVLEIATLGPGFTVDEPAETLGQRLALPSWLEPQRRTLEAHLVPF